MMAKVQQCVERVPDLLSSGAAGDWDEMERVAADLDRLEGQADDIKREIRGHLTTSLFSSVERTELLCLLHDLDSIADACQDAGKVMCMRPTPLPAALVPGFERLGKLLVGAGAKMTAVTVRLSGSGGEAVEKLDVQSIISELEEVGRAEYECDEEQHQLQRDMFNMEDRLQPMDIFFIMNIIKELGEVADKMENASDSLVRVLGSR
jgi:predicted phosphate transport protein (TIGR00153 family)